MNAAVAQAIVAIYAMTDVNDAQKQQIVEHLVAISKSSSDTANKEAQDTIKTNVEEKDAVKEVTICGQKVRTDSTTLILEDVKSLSADDLAALHQLTQLECFTLQRSSWEMLPPNLFEKHPLLRRAWIIDNPNLGSLPENLFARNPKLECVDLSGNNLIKLPPKLLSHLRGLKGVAFHGNPLTHVPIEWYAFHNMWSNLTKGQYTQTTVCYYVKSWPEALYQRLDVPVPSDPYAR